MRSTVKYRPANQHEWRKWLEEILSTMEELVQFHSELVEEGKLGRDDSSGELLDTFYWTLSDYLGKPHDTPE